MPSQMYSTAAKGVAMTEKFALIVRVVAEPVMRPPTDAEIDTAESQFGDIDIDRRVRWSMSTVRDYSGAAGTFVEVENSGDVCTVAADELTIDDGRHIDNWPLWGRGDPPPLRVELGRVGRPLVLLAVGGGDQVFDHWDPESTICVGQGARCEVAEPGADNSFTLYAKAVFRRRPAAEIRVGKLDGRTTRHGGTVHPFPEP